MAGKVFHEEIANTIKYECWKTLVILSPSYLTSPWCAYEANLSILQCPGKSAEQRKLVDVFFFFFFFFFFFL